MFGALVVVQVNLLPGVQILQHPCSLFWLFVCLFVCLFDWLVGWLFGCLVVWLVGWSIGWGLVVYVECGD